MKYLSIFILLQMLTFIGFSVLGFLMGAESNDELMMGLIILSIQNSAIITLLIYVASKLKNK